MIFQSIISAIEDICFKRGNLSKSLYTEKLYQRALLTLGIMVNQLSKAGDQKTATDIIEQVHQKLGLHGIIHLFTCLSHLIAECKNQKRMIISVCGIKV